MPVGFREDDKQYVSVRDSSLCFVSKVPAPGYIPFKEKFIRKLKFIEGRITSISFYSNEWDGKILTGWNIVINDGVDIFQLDLSFNSNEGSRFMKVARNIEYEEWVTIKIWRDTAHEKTAIAFSQNGQNVEEYWKYNQYDQNGDLIREGNLPDPKTRIRPGTNKKLYDWSESEDILLLDVKDVVAPFVAKLTKENPVKMTPRTIQSVQDIDHDEYDGEGREEEFSGPPVATTEPVWENEPEMNFNENTPVKNVTPPPTAVPAAPPVTKAAPPMERKELLGNQPAPMERKTVTVTSKPMPKQPSDGDIPF